MAIMPSDKPRYLLLTMLDEPEAIPRDDGPANLRLECGPEDGFIIERIAPMLDMSPRFENPRAAVPGRRPVPSLGHAVKLADLLEARTLARALPGDLAAREASSSPQTVGRSGRDRYSSPWPGAKADGLSFAAAAARSGAVAIVADRLPDTDPGAPVIVANASRRRHARGAGPCRGEAASWPAGNHRGGHRHQRPRRRSACSPASSGRRPVSRGEPRHHRLRHHKGATYGSLTTPDHVALQRTLEHLKAEGVTHLAMEASSHGLDQHGSMGSG